VITIIAAVDKNYCIGSSKTGKMGWYIPEELKFFRMMTINKSIVMGRTTAESVGYLKDRNNIVMTNSKEYQKENFTRMGFYEILKLSESEEVMICGGAKIYKLFLPIADKIILSCLDLESEGDVFFPKIPKNFCCINVDQLEKFTIKEYKRIKVNQANHRSEVHK
jgi:dihydrofolate reductase